MSFDSKLFDKIRIAPRGPKRAPVRAEATLCEWQGCKNAGSHRAPKGRSREREDWRFCMEHVREYNQSYNYFSGMTDDAAIALQQGRRIAARLSGQRRGGDDIVGDARPGGALCHSLPALACW